MWIPRITVTALLTLVLGGCREGVQPFMPDEREIEKGAAYALTFGSGQDADPRWSPDGDSVIYHTTLFNTVPQVSGVLLRIPARGGAAVPILPDVQQAGGRPFVTPAYSPASNRVAYLDMLSVDVPSSCFRVDGGTPSCTTFQPLLDSALLRVRRIGESGSIALDPSITVRFAGTDPAHRFLAAGPWFEQFFPFQERYRLEHAMLFRPSWAPDGERLAFSDGLAIHSWRVGDPSSAIVPMTVNGVSAAWSPDGEWIAFTVLPRADSVVHQCSCPLGGLAIQAFRTVYQSGPGVLMLVRPDGSERIELGEGEDPAWSPDGAFIYVRRAGRIARIARAGGAVTPIANTEGGRSPAVSPDGTRLAFSRSKPSDVTLDYDIWIATLAQ
ncbi:hypothetical protein BH23GEM9_BH23GEM9_12420 [soil metagenome]